MSTFGILLYYELRRLILTPITYVVTALFLGFMAGLYFLLLIEYNEIPHELPAAGAFFSIFWLPALLIIPLLTMHSLSEERKQGSLELLFVTPARPLAVACAKFTSAYGFYLFLWACTLSFPYLCALDHDWAVLQAGLLESASLLGGFLFISVSSFMYIALGILASSLTKSQLAAGMLSFALLFILVVGAKALLSFPLLDSLGLDRLYPLIETIDPFQHLADFCRGVVDTRPMIIYPCFGIFAIGLTGLVLDAKA